jgi:predicted metal-dependent hydrolase
MNADKNEGKGSQLNLPLEVPRGTFASHAHICLGGRLVEYTIRRSPRRGSITLTIDERGLRVGAPWRAGERAIENQLRRHEAWVLRKLAEWQQRRAAPRRWEDGETLMLMGEPLRITLAPGFHAIGRNDDRLMVGTSAEPHPGEIAGKVTAWLREQALVCFHERIAHYVPLLPAPAPQVRLSSARTRWGSCHATGRILLNWRLIQMPLQLVDYVVVHELAHLKEMNHSPRFWRIVARIIPDYAARRKAIRIDGHRYVLA